MACTDAAAVTRADAAAIAGVAVDTGAQTGAASAGTWTKATMAVGLAPLAASSATQVPTTAATAVASGNAVASVCANAKAGANADAVANACTVA